MANRLINEISPYLLQHAENPVDWHPWGDEAIQKARQENKPIFLSIGYAACHWCHVMAHESFEDNEIAAILNQNFISIKVDREERPEIDDIYMNAVVMLTGRGGWPLSVFLTPELKPFYGGTYFPPVRRYNMPSFKEILLTISHLWQADREKLLSSSEEIAVHLNKSYAIQGDTLDYTEKTISSAVSTLSDNYDWQYGGWGKAPKFPQPMVIEFLLQQATRGNETALKMATHALDAMSKGGIYDVLGGGFSRYSTDDRWLVPHFEKMLYDNALLSKCYLYAYDLTRKERYKQIAIETLDFIIRDMSSLDTQNTLQGFYSSIDADSEGQEGEYYLWSMAEVSKVLSQSKNESQQFSEIDWVKFCTQAYNLTEKGNFEGKNVLQRSIPYQQLADDYGMNLEEVDRLLNLIHQALYKKRLERVPPEIDDKVLAFWNALTIVSLSEAGRLLGRKDYTQYAENGAVFLLENLFENGRLFHAYRDGKAVHDGLLSDYASLSLSSFYLYQNTQKVDWFQRARYFADQMIELFYEPGKGFYETSRFHEQLIARPLIYQDNAIPSGNALATRALIYMSGLTGDQRYRRIAEDNFSLIAKLLDYPTFIGYWLCGLDLLTHPLYEVAIVAEEEDSRFQEMAHAVNSSFRPDIILASGTIPLQNDAPDLLNMREPISGSPTAYVCQQFVCNKPVVGLNALMSQLNIPN